MVKNKSIINFSLRKGVVSGGFKNENKMGLFKKIFGDDKSASETPRADQVTPWINLTAMEQLDDILERSKTKVQIIFKHSTRCGISRMVMNQFKKEYALTQNEADLYYLDLLNYRSISAAIADKFQVRHESPQLLVIKNGVVVAQDSHSGINNLNLGKFV